MVQPAVTGLVPGCSPSLPWVFHSRKQTLPIPWLDWVPSSSSAVLHPRASLPPALPRMGDVLMYNVSHMSSCSLDVPDAVCLLPAPSFAGFLLHWSPQSLGTLSPSNLDHSLSNLHSCLVRTNQAKSKGKNTPNVRQFSSHVQDCEAELSHCPSKFTTQMTTDSTYIYGKISIELPTLQLITNIYRALAMYLVLF